MNRLDIRNSSPSLTSKTSTFRDGSMRLRRLMVPMGVSDQSSSSNRALTMHHRPARNIVRRECLGERSLQTVSGSAPPSLNGHALLGFDSVISVNYLRAIAHAREVLSEANRLLRLGGFGGDSCHKRLLGIRDRQHRRRHEMQGLRHPGREKAKRRSQQDAERQQR
ncbi:hypothetical protein MHPYR_470032 [uncultured Mycobacterium sp.]|uniref:Uncharacterized protein n=1 Tax=uncultured Mycobacterium sp. TaxID=171292 RepID=A0A1Y5PP69_9MYCO|nr:hypothetical protein MHPYR_470032 [uncultured Mycobacterium sp.]